MAPPARQERLMNNLTMQSSSRLPRRVTAALFRVDSGGRQFDAWTLTRVPLRPLTTKYLAGQYHWRNTSHHWFFPADLTEGQEIRARVSLICRSVGVFCNMRKQIAQLWDQFATEICRQQPGQDNAATHVGVCLTRNVTFQMMKGAKC